MIAREDRNRSSARVAANPHLKQQAALATMHGKEAVIAPALRDGLGLLVATVRGLDTDALGTFTGESPRVGTMRETAIAKARLGMAATGLPIGRASEGSYGPHPRIPFGPAGVGLIVPVDDVLGIVVTEHPIDDAPAYDHAIAADAHELTAFRDRIGFPNHRGKRPRADGRSHADPGQCSECNP